MHDPIQDNPQFAGPRHSAARRTLRAIAVYEAVKGFAALAAMLGLVDLAHHDVRRLAIELIGRFKLDPLAHYPSLLLHYADVLSTAQLMPVFLLGTGYVVLRMAEAYGLWFGRTWGEELGAISGALYIPFEGRHLWERPSVVTALVLAGNAFLVGFLVWVLWRRRRGARA